MNTRITSRTALTPQPVARATLASALSLLVPFALFCALLMFGPLALGADRPWSLLTLRTAAAVLLLLWGVAQAVDGELRLVFSPLYAPVLLFAGVVAFQLAWGKTAYWETTFASVLWTIAGESALSTMG